MALQEQRNNAQQQAAASESGNEQVQKVEVESSENVANGTTPSEEPVKQEEQKEKPSSDGSEAEAVAEATSATPQEKRDKKKVTRIVTEEEISPRPSFWPLLLALSICVLAVGLMFHPVILGIGAVLVLVSAIGWAREKL
ncbi:MAG: cytochrome c oxidase subunit 4 [Ktedonobacteraceae bacterium]|nr:cytochrome c oxidase subunit 4 [Ktedonobacteraceae bacterium]